MINHYEIITVSLELTFLDGALGFKGSSRLIVTLIAVSSFIGYEVGVTTEVSCCAEMNSLVPGSNIDGTNGVESAEEHDRLLV